MGYDLNLRAIRVGKCKYLFFKSLSCRFHWDTPINQPLPPIFERRLRHAESCACDFAGARQSPRCIGPWEKSENRPRRTRVIAEIKVVRPGIVEIDCALDKTQ